jgi:putative transposase
MSRFKILSHTVWHCEYHIVWTPKYRYPVLQGKVKEQVEMVVREQSRQLGCEVVELNVQVDHVHALVRIPPKMSISEYMGRVKGKCALRIFSVCRDLRRKPYWGNHFWAQGYCVDTVGLDHEMIRKYVKWQEKAEQKQEQLRFIK